MREVRCVANPHALVGEGPVWDDRRQVLWWIDVKEPRLFRYDPASGENHAFAMPERVGCVALRANGGLIGAFLSGFAWIDPETGATTPIADPEPHRPGNRFNDGKCDRRGRLFAGTLDNAEVECTGTLYRLDPDLSVHVMCTDVHLSNGLGWSPDDRILYYTDSLRRTIWPTTTTSRRAQWPTGAPLRACPRTRDFPTGCASMPRAACGARTGAAGA